MENTEQAREAEEEYAKSRGAAWSQDGQPVQDGQTDRGGEAGVDKWSVKSADPLYAVPSGMRVRLYSHISGLSRMKTSLTGILYQ